MRLVLRLFISGTSPRVVANLELACRAQMGENYALEVIDVLQRPDEATRAGVIATPTILRLRPEPSKKIVGELDDERQAQLALRLLLEPEDRPSE